jgi:hypothetical protein
MMTIAPSRANYVSRLVARENAADVVDITIVGMLDRVVRQRALRQRHPRIDPINVGELHVSEQSD